MVHDDIGFEAAGGASPFTLHSYSQHRFQHQHDDNHIVPVVVLREWWSCVRMGSSKPRQIQARSGARCFFSDGLEGSPRIFTLPKRTLQPQIYLERG